MDPKETPSATMEDIKSNATAEIRNFPKEIFDGASNNDVIHGASVSVPMGSTLKVVR
jgi:hypothetical protein